MDLNYRWPVPNPHKTMLLPLRFRFCSSFEYPEFFCFHLPFIPMSPTKKYKFSLQNGYIRFPHLCPSFSLVWNQLSNHGKSLGCQKPEANMRTATCLDLLRWYQCLGEDMVGIKTRVLNAAEIALFSGGYIESNVYTVDVLYSCVFFLRMYINTY